MGKAAHGSIVTIDHNAQKLIITSVRGDDWTLEKQMCQLGLGEGLTGHVALTGKPYLCSRHAKSIRITTRFSITSAAS